jgi:hypothetical protein
MGMRHRCRPILLGVLSLLVLLVSSIPVTAQEATPDPAGQGVEGVLLEYTLPEEAHLLPDPARAITPTLGVFYTVWAPQTSYTYDGSMTDGTLIRCVLSGALVITSAGATPLITSQATPQATPQAAPEGGELRLAPGDCIVHAAADPFTQRTDGSEELVLLEALLFLTTSPPPWHSPGLAEGIVVDQSHSVGDLIPPSWAELPPGPVTIRLERVLLAPEETLPLAISPAIHAVGPETMVDQFRLAETDSTLTNTGDRQIPVLIVTVTPE